MNGRSKMVLLGLLAIGLLAALLLLAGPKLGLWGTPGGSAGGGAGGPITLFFSADTVGHLEPCGCAAGQWGGLPRRATALAGDDSNPRLIVDCGDLTAGPRTWELIAYRYLLEGLGRMNYAAANLGGNEATLSADDLRAIAADSPVPLISANVLDAGSGEPVVRPYVIVEVAGRKVGIVGVTDPPQVLPVGAGLRVERAELVLARVLPELRGRVDVLVVAAGMDEERLMELASANQEADLVLGGRVAQSSERLRDAGGTPVAWLGSKGKVLGKVTFTPGGAGEFHAIALTERFRDAPALKQLVEKFNLELGEHAGHQHGVERLLSIAPRSPRNPKLNAYQDPASCRPCHESAYVSWADAKHAHALETLEQRNRQHIPECLGCHTTAFGASDGFLTRSRTPGREFVSCGSCHGRGRNHALAMREQPFTGSADLPTVTAETCIRCHDAENSPTFDYETFWAKIKHAREPDQDRFKGPAVPTTQPGEPPARGS